MFTRRTATVIMSAPDASCAWTMTAGEEYLPVPTMSREANVLPAMTRLSVGIFLVLLTASDEVDDLNLIALADLREIEDRALEHHEIVFDRHATGVDIELSQQA